MHLNCGVGEDSWESLGLQGDPTSPFWRRSALGFLWKEGCYLTYSRKNKKAMWVNLSSSVQFSHSAVSDSLWPHELQHARPPCPSPTPGVHPNPHPSSWWCHPAISSSVVPFASCPQSLPAWVFSSESTLSMRWPKYWSFSFNISPSNEHPGLISFRKD